MNETDKYKLLTVQSDEHSLSVFTESIHVQINGVMVLSTSEPCLYNELVEALEELADECEGWVRHYYSKDLHPALKGRYERDMEPVIIARKLIAKARGER
jgi:hypothetical protein